MRFFLLFCFSPVLLPIIDWILDDEYQVRPYVTVTKVPNFDATQLPYWDIYEREGTAQSIKLGGTMAGEFYAGLSGGQRKLFLFELIYQRTKNQSKLLIVLDEPFAVRFVCCY